MPLSNLVMAEEVLSLPPSERADLAKLLIQSLEGEKRMDQDIKAELTSRLDNLRSGKDPGLTFHKVFDCAQ